MKTVLFFRFFAIWYFTALILMFVGLLTSPFTDSAQHFLGMAEHAAAYAAIIAVVMLVINRRKR